MLVIIAISILFGYAILGYKKPGIAMITLPIAVALPPLYIYTTFYTEEDMLAALAFAALIFFAILIAVLISRREPDVDQWPQILAKWILTSFVSLFLLAALLIVLGWGGYASLLFAFFMAGIARFGLISKDATAAYVISTIGSSMQQNLPLPMALESAAAGQTDKRARILRRIKKWLVQGYSLSESIKRGFPKCPGYAVAMIAAAERIDQLPLAIKSIEADMAARANESRKIRPIHPLYPVILIVFMFFILLAVMTFVIPKFEMVLVDMFEGASLPAATQFLLNITAYIAYDMGPLLLIALAIIVFVVVPLSIRIKFRPRRPDKPYLISRIADFIKWHLPVLHWFEKNYSTVQAVELLRLSLNAGCTVNDAIANTLGLDVNNRFKKRLRSWLAKVEAGDNISNSARETKLANALAWAFDEQVNQGNTLAILETLESFYRSNYSYRVNLARFIMWPCVTIIMGAMVGFVVYAFFSPSIAIIHHLSDLVMP